MRNEVVDDDGGTKVLKNALRGFTSLARFRIEVTVVMQGEKQPIGFRLRGATTNRPNVRTNRGRTWPRVFATGGILKLVLELGRWTAEETVLKGERT